MNTVQTFGFVGLLAASSVVLGTTNANAASLSLNTTLDSTSTTSGPTFTVNNNFAGSDTISLSVSGTPNFYSVDSQGYTTNAAGVLTQTSNYGAIGTTGINGTYNGNNYGSLLLGNNTLGFKQLFAANAANGLGSSTPTSNLSFSNVSLSSLFGSGLSTGTILEFRVADSVGGDNLGAFTVSGSINQAEAVPEPFTIIGSLVGGTAALRMRKKLKSDKI
jgi:hypothetical protein